ncbi:MAG: preprotein translocase subunit SecA [Bryobacterales bacterium]|nr:preprotein translocase subunit SecA [Bryobacterales bacterium]
MIDPILAKLFGTANERAVKRMQPVVQSINALEPAMEKLSDAELKQQTAKFRDRLEKGETLDDLLPEAFATVREAGRRVLGMRHYDVQLIGGMVLHQGKIAEMKTGEGKTLVATLPVYLNALAGKGVHVITVNDYLARRDSEWMGQIYRFLGMTVGVIIHNLSDRQRQEAYGCDITYGTNNEFGFDYLRDNMKFRLEDCVQREHSYSIVDEVDSILIDEARTPLIISGPTEGTTDKFIRPNSVIPFLEKGEVHDTDEPGVKRYTGDFTVDEKQRAVALTEEGVRKVERLLGVENLYDPSMIELNHHVQQSLRAHALYQVDRDYVVQDGQVVIVDEFTGRLMPGRRWSDGLHQAVEAKEGVRVENETQTFATITFQNYFRMYSKLAGMTGTAETEAAEFSKIYNLDVVAIPTNRPLLRKENADVVFRTQEEKWRNAAKEIKELHEKGQPVLVGTISVEKSEKLSSMLKRMGVRHEVLNAKNHEREASIIAQAGRKGAVTVSTNMAGRGTDILLGGNAEFLAEERLKKDGKSHATVAPEAWEEALRDAKRTTDLEHDDVVKLGGLHVLGTERHESRRIDNQLRGRAGRQGDPGSSRFYLALDDDLLRIFGGEKVQNLMLRLGMEEDVPIESRLISKRIEAAQKAVEAQHFASRKHLLEYDDVMNKQRVAIYGWRRQLLEGKDQRERIFEMVRALVGYYIDNRCPENAQTTNWDLTGLQQDILTQFGARIEPKDYIDDTREQIEEKLFALLEKRYDDKAATVGPAVMREAESVIMLSVIDAQWKDHLLSMDHLKEGIGLRGYGQKDPLIEYKKESYGLFQELMERIEDEIVRHLFFLQFQFNERPPQDGGAFAGGGGFDGGLDSPFAGASEQVFDGYETNGVSADAQQRRADRELANVTQSIHRAKDRELSRLQMGAGESSGPQSVKRSEPKVGRNDPCPCGSGKKYKKCCGA